MNIEQYKKIYYNVGTMAPIENGVQTLVYMLLYEIFENVDYEIVVISNLFKKSKFMTLSGISDLAIVTKDFNYYNHNDDDIQKIKFCVEVKSIGVKLVNYAEQVLGQLLTFDKALITNGNEWKYYNMGEYLKKKSIDENGELWAGFKADINKVIQSERQVARLKKCISNARNPLLKEQNNKTKKEVENEIEKGKESIEKFLTDNKWIYEFLDEPTWSVELFNNKGELMLKNYVELIKNLNGILLEI